MPDLSLEVQVREALKGPCEHCKAGLTIKLVTRCEPCNVAAVARALEDVKSLVCDMLRGDDWYEEDIASELVEMELRFVRALREG